MIIDMHTHGKLAKSLPFSEKYTRRLFQEAKSRGLDALCLTEHFNTQEFERIYAFIQKNYPQDGDTFLVEGIRIFPGLEIDMHEGGHNLVIGCFEEIMDLREHVLTGHSAADFLRAEDLFARVKNYNVLFGAAHVFREGCHNLELPDELIKQYDFFDLNGKDTGLQGLDNWKRVDAAAERYNKPVLAGSDTHQYLQYKTVYNDFQQEVNTVSSLKSEIQKGNYTVHVDDFISGKVEAAGLLKKALKQLQRAGGSYDIALDAGEKQQVL